MCRICMLALREHAVLFFCLVNLKQKYLPYQPPNACIVINVAKHLYGKIYCFSSANQIEIEFNMQINFWVYILL